MDVDQTKILFLFFSFFFPSFLFPRRIYFHLPPGGPGEGGAGGREARGCRAGARQSRLGRSAASRSLLSITLPLIGIYTDPRGGGARQAPRGCRAAGPSPAERPLGGPYMDTYIGKTPGSKNQLFPRVRLFEKYHHGRAHRTPMSSSVEVFLEMPRPREKLNF